MEQLTSKMRPTFKFKKCNKCNQKRKHLNEFSECKQCEKCKRCHKQRKDYSTEFDMCISCYKHIEQTTPSRFEPNFKFEKCKRCDQRYDHLNEFQICNSCCEQMEHMIPNGFKPNFKYEKCKRCENQRDFLNEFQICYLCYIPKGFNLNLNFNEKCKKCNQKRNYLNEFLFCNLCYNQTTFIESGSEVIDDFIRHTLGGMEFVSYDRFKDIEFVAEGGFSKIYKATWIDGPLNKQKSRNGETTVALKELNNSKDINFKHLNELKIYCNLVSKEYNSSINTYYGITQEPNTKNFLIIMKYYDLGDLAHYVTTNDFFNISWRDKLSILTDIVIGLNNIHNMNIIHKDCHSGNIFISRHHYFVTNDEAIVGDLGISKSAIDNDDDELYGIIPYVAPEIFQGQKYTKASDIYSFGMIMWELMTSRKPFWDQIHDTSLIIKICDGFRPPIVTNAPEGYIELMQRCWNSEPNNRPTTSELRNKFCDIQINESRNLTEIIKTPEIGPIETNNPGAIYKSRPLSAMIKSAESTRSLRSQSVISKPDKRKFNNLNLTENDNDDVNIVIKKVKQEYLTTEFEFGIADDDINSRKSDQNIDIDIDIDIDYATKELGFDIKLPPSILDR